MRVACLEPYAARSHVAFLDGLRAHSCHELVPFTQPARAWKWRMRLSSLHLADALTATPGPWDLLLASDYVPLAELRALLPPALARVPAVVLFHENQLTYPLQPGEARDHQYALTHLHALLAAERAVFFSEFHRRELFGAFPALLRHAPDVDWRPWLARAEERSVVLPLGTDAPLRAPAPPDPAPVVLWNHRWEYDKDPARFVEALLALQAEGEAFRVRLVGERFRTEPPDRARLLAALGERVEDLGFVEDRSAYLDALRTAHVHVSTARHEFFGLGALEALRSSLLPVWPRALAYPELLPPALREDARFTYAPSDGPSACLRAALGAAREGSWTEERALLRAHARAYSWEHVARHFDALFEAVSARVKD